jgi:multiple antibiotic resistance protein
VNNVFVQIVFKNSGRIEKVLGKPGINVIRKIFGVILLAIAVKLFATKIKELF